jgi:hypothetical protein
MSVLHSKPETLAPSIQHQHLVSTENETGAAMRGDMGESQEAYKEIQRLSTVGSLGAGNVPCPFYQWHRTSGSEQTINE